MTDYQKLLSDSQNSLIDKIVIETGLSWASKLSKKENWGWQAKIIEGNKKSDLFELYFKTSSNDACFIVSVSHRNFRKLSKFREDNIEIKIIKYNSYVDSSNFEDIKNTLRQTVYSWIMPVLYRQCCKKFTKQIKEELVSVVWSPQRVQKLLEEDRWDIIDS